MPLYSPELPPTKCTLTTTHCDAQVVYEVVPTHPHFCVQAGSCVWHILTRVGQNRIYTPYMTVYLVIPLPNIPYIHRIYMVLANPIHSNSSNRLYTIMKHCDAQVAYEVIPTHHHFCVQAGSCVWHIINLPTDLT